MPTATRKRFRAEPMPADCQRDMNLWTTLVELEQPRGQCRGCALRRGSLANRDFGTFGKIVDVLLRGGDFRCHHARLGAPVCTTAPTRQCRGFAALLVALQHRFRLGKRLADSGATPGKYVVSETKEG